MILQMVDIDIAEKALKKFVMEFEKLYGKDKMTFNVHLMTHISARVRNSGPLWATSTFSFESFNGTLLRFFNRTTHVQQQIVKRFLKWRDLTIKLSENLRIFGHPHPVTIPVHHMLAIEDLFGVRVQQGQYCDRFIIDSVLFHTETNTRLQKRNNSVAELADGTLCKILSVLAFNPNVKYMQYLLPK